MQILAAHRAQKSHASYYRGSAHMHTNVTQQTSISALVWSFALISALITISCAVPAYLMPVQVPSIADYVAWPGAALVWFTIGDGEWFGLMAVIAAVVLNTSIAALLGAFLGLLCSRRR